MTLVRGNLLNVSTEEIYGAEISVKNGIITCVKSVKGNFEGLILPGFIDAHIHIESSMLTPSRFAEAVVPHGTTSVVSDPHEIANVMGLNGIEYMSKDSSSVPLKLFLTAPSCVPATVFETSGAVISTEEIVDLLEEDFVVAMGEMMNFPGVLNNDSVVMAKLNAAKKIGKPVDGHAPLLSGSELCKYVLSGISTDHECNTKNEALEKMRLGIKVMLREGSSAKNLKDLATLGGDFIVSDDKHPEDLLIGHVDEMLRKAVEYGIDPVHAVKMVTLNPSNHYNLNTGNIVPGKAADLVFIDSLEELNVERVVIDGTLVAQGGNPLFDVKPIEIPSTFKLKPKNPFDFDIPTKGSNATVRVIKVDDGQLITSETSAILNTKDGKLDANLGEDILSSLELPVAGLMSNKSLAEVSSDLRILHHAVKEMGSKLKSPFMTLSFMALLVIPKLKISDMGLFDVEKFDFVDLIKK